MRPVVLLASLIAGAWLGGTAHAAPDDPSADPDRFPRVAPYGAFVGGGAYEIIDRRQDDLDRRQNRFWTPALARVGLAGKVSPHFTVQSEVELNAGPYGTSVWEGQAAIQVRNQLIRFQHKDVLGSGDRVRLEVGRITDPASVNYVSVHIANLLLSDELGRGPLLFSGFNRGNGARVEYTVGKVLSAGFTVNAGNPTSTTSTLAIGGTFPPFQRFYEVPWSVVGRDARGFPQSSFHSVVLTPAVQLNTDVLQAQFALQSFSADTSMNTDVDERITGTNLRAGARLSLADGAFAVFASGSRMLNDVVNLTDNATLADGKYLGMVGGGGFDVTLKDRSGFGAQYDLVYEEERGLEPELNHFVNVGATVALAPTVFLSGRFALLQVCQNQDAVDRCDVNGRRHVMLTMMAVLGASRDVQP